MAFLKKIKLPDESAAREIYDAGAMRASLKGVANGVAELDANGTVPKNQLPNLDEKENVSNKVVNITSGSTDIQYPSAKAVYNAIGNIIPQYPSEANVDFNLSYNSTSGMAWTQSQKAYVSGTILYVQGVNLAGIEQQLKEI